MPALRRVAAAALLAGLAAGIVLVIGRLGFGDEPSWPIASGLFAVLLGAQLIRPGPHHARPDGPPVPASWAAATGEQEAPAPRQLPVRRP